MICRHSCYRSSLVYALYSCRFCKAACGVHDLLFMPSMLPQGGRAPSALSTLSAAAVYTIRHVGV